MKREFEMSQEQLDKMLKACTPAPAIALQCGHVPSQQEMANSAWKKLGDEMGFLLETAEPIQGKGPRFFMAVQT